MGKISKNLNFIYQCQIQGTASQALWEQHCLHKDCGNRKLDPYWLFRQICGNNCSHKDCGNTKWGFPIGCSHKFVGTAYYGVGPKSWNRKIPNGRIFLFTDFCPPPSFEICAKVAVHLFHLTKTNTK